MAKKQNPLLAAFEAKLEANYKQRLEINNEMDLIAFMKTVHEELGVGKGRALKVFNAYRANKREIAEKIREDYGPDKDTGDKQILHTKSSYAKLLKRIFGPESWQKVKTWFPLLFEYWED
jgi:hypothetical protein